MNSAGVFAFPSMCLIDSKKLPLIASGLALALTLTGAVFAFAIVKGIDDARED